MKAASRGLWRGGGLPGAVLSPTDLGSRKSFKMQRVTATPVTEERDCCYAAVPFIVAGERAARSERPSEGL